MEFILNTSRKIDNDQLKEFTFGDINSLEDKLAICFMNPEDLSKIKVSPKSNVKISSKKNSIVVKSFEDSKVPKGMILLPVSIWSNQLTEVEEGEIKYKNISVKVEGSNDPIIKFANILKIIKGD